MITDDDCDDTIIKS